MGADNSLKYKLRLLLTYRDALRNHLPPLSAQYIKHFAESQKRAAARLEGKQRVEVAFFLTIPGMWKSDYLFRALQADGHFHPYIVVYPYSTYKGFDPNEVEATLERTCEFVRQRGFEYVVPRDKRTGRWLDPKHIYDPDIVIFTTPYKDFPPQYFVYHYRDRLCCYVPYGFSSLNLQRVNYDLIFHNLVGMHFVESELHKELASSFARCRGANIVVTGYPGTEVFLRSDYHPADVWKKQSTPKKRIIWAPHHTIDGAMQISTFLLHYESMLTLAERYADSVQFVFKPHQLLKFKLQQLWGNDRVEQYYRRWQELSNGQLEESSYVDLFLTSDAMIHDCGSFTTEYLFTHKPVMYLTHDEDFASRFNPFGQKAFECHYRGANLEQIDEFIKNVVIGGIDPKQEAREAFFDQYLKPRDGLLPSQYITKIFLNCIEGKPLPL